MQLNLCLDLFLKNQIYKNNSIHTIDDYRVIISKFIVFVGDIDSFSLTAEFINDYNVFLRGSVCNTSVRTYIRHIRVFIRFLIKSNLCPDIYDGIIMPRSDKLVVDILSSDEVKQLLNVDILKQAFPTHFYFVRNRLMIMLMLDCGLRASEVVGIKKRDINFKSGYFKITGKGLKQRIVPFGNKIDTHIKEYLKISLIREYLFTDRSGQPLTTCVFKKMFCRLRRYTGIERLYPHLLRHTFATNFLLYGNGDIYQLSMLLGHSSTKTTEIYLHIANYYRFMEHKQAFSFLDGL